MTPVPFNPYPSSSSPVVVEGDWLNFSVVLTERGSRQEDIHIYLLSLELFRVCVPTLDVKTMTLQIATFECSLCGLTKKKVTEHHNISKLFFKCIIFRS